MKVITSFFFKLMLVLPLSLTSDTLQAEIKTLCVFDLLGANGPIYAQMKDYKIAALEWGVSFQLKPYLNEKSAAIDFKAGRCDAASFTGIQSRQFNLFSGSLDAMGALPNYEHLKTVVRAISSRQAAPLMVNEPYEVVGIIPLGTAFLFVNDRSLVDDHVEKGRDLSSIRISIMDSDPAQAELIGLVGTTSVSSSIAEMYKQFNKGTVDVTYGPAVVYEAMELHKGLNSNGGVVHFPLAQLSLQIMIHRIGFPERFGHKSRQYTLSQFDHAVMRAKQYEARIPPAIWLEISETHQRKYHEMYRKTRILLRDKGIYDAKMLKLMRLTRCKKNPKRAECSAADKE